MSIPSRPSAEQAPLPVYLGPALTRWQPRSLDDVQAAIDDGTVGERHWLDAKAQLGSTDSAKKGLARDLASFANDGGGLLVGVREDKAAGTFHVDPVPLSGLAEAIDQIARSRCDPPLYVVCYPLPGLASADGVARGVLLVHVPPSPLAPHMVEGRYYGRGDTTNHQLTDGEVARLHAARTTRQATSEQVIAAEIARDPLPTAHHRLSHLHVVAQPLASPPDLLTPLIGTPALRSQVHAAADKVPGANSVSPNWGYMQYDVPRAEGHGFHSYGLDARQFLRELEGAEEANLLDVEVHDNGRLSLFCGGASFTRQDRQYVDDVAVVVLTRCLVTLAGQLAAERGYAGRWLLAIGITDLSRQQSSSAAGGSVRTASRFPPYSADSYLKDTEAVTVEMLQRPGAVTRRLVGRLLRALGIDRDQEHEQRLADA